MCDEFEMQFITHYSVKNRSTHSLDSLLHSEKQIFQCADVGKNINDFLSRYVRCACGMKKPARGHHDIPQYSIFDSCVSFSLLTTVLVSNGFIALNLAMPMYF